MCRPMLLISFGESSGKTISGERSNSRAVARTGIFEIYISFNRETYVTVRLTKRNKWTNTRRSFIYERY